LPKANCKHKCHNFAYSVQQKINTVHESRTQGLSVQATAKLWGCYVDSVLYHKQQLAIYIEKVLVNHNAKTANKGRTPVDIKLVENNVNQWYKELEMEDIPLKRVIL
jgi:hypothetical protein